MHGPKAELETLRVHQANERTMLAWMRTGIALMALGFAIARFGIFLRQVAALGGTKLTEPHDVGSAWIGGLLVVLGVAVNVAGTLRYGRIRAAIHRGDVGAPSAALVYGLGLVGTLLGVAMALLLARALAE